MYQSGCYYNIEIIASDQDNYTLNHAEHGKINMPKNAADAGLLVGDRLEVFIFNDDKGNQIATTTKSKAKVGDFATLKVLKINAQGAWLDWGLIYPLLVPKEWHEADLLEGDYCLVKLIYDEPSGKVLGKEKVDDLLSNETLTVTEKQIIEGIIYRDTPLGFQVIINKVHLGLLHYNEVFKELYVGDTFTGFIKSIKPDNKINVMLGKPGFTRVEDEAGGIVQALKKNNGFLPYHDKSHADDIYKAFGMSKKTFKMTIGKLYKEKKITIEPDGIKLV